MPPATFLTWHRLFFVFHVLRRGDRVSSSLLIPRRMKSLVYGPMCLLSQLYIVRIINTGGEKTKHLMPTHENDTQHLIYLFIQCWWRCSSLRICIAFISRLNLDWLTTRDPSCFTARVNVLLLNRLFWWWAKQRESKCDFDKDEAIFHSARRGFPVGLIGFLLYTQHAPSAAAQHFLNMALYRDERRRHSLWNWKYEA